MLRMPPANSTSADMTSPEPREKQHAGVPRVSLHHHDPCQDNQDGHDGDYREGGKGPGKK